MIHVGAGMSLGRSFTSFIFNHKILLVEELCTFERRKNKKEGKTHLFKLTYFKLCSVPMAPVFFISKTAASGLPNTSLPQEISCLFPLHYTRRSENGFLFHSLKVRFSFFTGKIKFNK